MNRIYPISNNIGCLNGSGSAPKSHMGWFGGSSQKPGDEFDLNRPRILNSWSNTYDSGYENIRNYIESKIGPLQINDANLQNKLSNMVVEGDKKTYEEWLSYSRDFLKVNIDGNNTLVKIQIPNLPKYKYMKEWMKNGIKNGIRRSLHLSNAFLPHNTDFKWNRKYRAYINTNSAMTLDELAHAIALDKRDGKNSGLEIYCGQVAYRQTMNGIPNTFSVPDNIRDSLPSKSNIGSGEKQMDTKPDIPSSKSSGGPYSKIEQLEKLIDLRKKGEITTEEFNDMKKELLS